MADDEHCYLFVANEKRKKRKYDKLIEYILSKNAKWKVISHEFLFAVKHNAGYWTILKGICYGKQQQIVLTKFHLK